MLAIAAIPLLGCRRILTDGVDRATELAFAEASDGGGDVRIGHLPADFPVSVPVDPKAAVWTACRMDLSDGDKGWMAAFHTDESPEQVLAFYDARLHRMTGDAGPALDLISKQLPPEMAQSFSGLSMTQKAHGEADTVQTEVMTPYEYGQEGQIFLRTYHRDGATLNANEKSTLFTLVVVTSGRPK